MVCYLKKLQKCVHFLAQIIATIMKIRCIHGKHVLPTYILITKRYLLRYCAIHSGENYEISFYVKKVDCVGI